MRRKHAGLLLAPVMTLLMVIALCACGQNESAEPLTAEHDLNAMVDSIQIEDGFKPALGIVLGSGLHPLADEVDIVQEIPYEDIEGVPPLNGRGA